MGFGSRMAKEAAAERAEMFRKELQLAEAAGDEEETGAPPPATPARNPAAAFARQAPGHSSASPPPPPPPPAAHGQQSAPGQRRRPTSFGQGLLTQPSTAPVKSAASRPTSFGGVQPQAAPGSRPSSFRHAASEHGEPVRARIQPARHLRLDRLIEEVSAFRNASPDDIKKVKQAAEKNPEATLDRLQKIYDMEVKPFKEKNATGIAEARILHPQDVVFSISVGTKQKIQIVPRAEAQANGLALLDGAHVISQAAANTPFGPPSELFGLSTGIPVVSTPVASPVEAPRPGPRP